ncbi:MAG: UDP-N-acetylglucosamine 2-epimerase (non-hydrolyzing) [Novosphingobium sp.]
MSPTRVLTIFGTRPEAIKLFPVLHALQRDARFTSRVCVSGQHRALLDQVLAIAGITPDHDLDLMRPDQGLDALVAGLIVGLGRVIDAEKPDWVVVQGDTATAMCGALAAYYRHIRVAHVEAGLRTGDIHHPWPEEVNRKVIATIAALHFAPTPNSADALRAENVAPDTIHVTGNTVVDALRWITQRIAAEPALGAGLAGLERRFAGKRLVAVTVHRRENFGPSLEAIAEAVRRIAARPDVAVVFPVHLNPNVRAVMSAALDGLANVALVEPLDYPSFTRLLGLAEVVLTDSGGVQEEAPSLGTPVLVMRRATERPEGIAAGTAKLVGTEAAAIVAETVRLLDDPIAYAAMARPHDPFGDGRAAARIVALLAAAGDDGRAGALQAGGGGPKSAA